MDWFSQKEYDCRLEWGWRGARQAAQRGDHIVIVDVLSFSTTAATAAAQEAVIYPCQNDAEAHEVSERNGAQKGVPRRDVPGKGRFSLSPLTFLAADRQTRVALSSPNGATCCRLASGADTLWVGALVNARATAHAAAQNRRDSAITVLTCGERWEARDADEESGDGPLRFAIEDYWGAGAILSYLPAHLSLSPEARAARAAFLDAEADLENLLLGCGSGRELVEKGYAEDVRHAARLNHYDTPMRFQNGRLSAAPRI